MYYVDTKTDRYQITTSYATKNQAERYGGVAKADELHLLAGESNHAISSIEDNVAGDFEDLGRVRTIFRSTTDGLTQSRYLLYYCDYDEDGNEFWNYTGISFQEYGDANKFLKTKTLVSFGDMAIVENPELTHCFDARGSAGSIDLASPQIYD